METPIADFLKQYQKKGMARLHMPGHKGHAFLGCEAYDITEIAGADDLFAPRGIIAQSERNAAALFGAGKTLFSTEGSSQCIRAMVALAANRNKGPGRPCFLAARNAHRSFLSALALMDADVQWLWPKEMHSLCSCEIYPDQVRRALQQAKQLPVAVYLTSPDYLGGQQPIKEIAEICHAYGVPLLVDNAHGAYLHFLKEKQHPMDLGADLCCDSAHKTLPVLTGGAYLHIHACAPKDFAEQAKMMMAVFGSTSPSYLVLASLDLCNAYLAHGFSEKLEKKIAEISIAKEKLMKNGWHFKKTEPLKMTIQCHEAYSGEMLAKRLREKGLECEYAEKGHLVLMPSAETKAEEFDQLVAALGKNQSPMPENVSWKLARAEQVKTIRQSIFSCQEKIPVSKALGRICAAPMISCPPAIPIVVSGERITADVLPLFAYYGINEIAVLKEEPFCQCDVQGKEEK